MGGPLVEALLIAPSFASQSQSFLFDASQTAKNAQIEKVLRVLIAIARASEVIAK